MKINSSSKKTGLTRFSEGYHLGPFRIIAGYIVGLTIIIGIADYPTGKWLLVAALAAYGTLLYFKPWQWFFIIPVLLPALDFSPLTGRLLLDEFDLFVLVTIVVGYWRTYSLKPQPWPNRLFPAAVLLLWITWFIATLRGLYPLLIWEGGLADSSHSPLEAWIVGKGLLWALLLLPLIRRVPSQISEKIQHRILQGLIVGLAIVVMVVLWERYVFVGLANFDNDFRVTGTFSSMNTGGAYIEAFIAFALPAMAVWILERRRKSLKFIGLFGLAAAGYAMFVTYSRGGYAGLLTGLGFVFLCTMWLRSGSPGRRWLVLAGLGVAAVAVAIPILSGGFARYRLSRSLEDLAIRKDHWIRALNLMDNDMMTKVGGMGFGQYPLVYLNRANPEKPPGTFTVMRGGENSFLRLGSGEPLYLDQVVDIKPEAKYTLSVRIRQPRGPASLEVPVCEKALLYSFACDWQQIVPDPDKTDWQTVTTSLSTIALGNTKAWLAPPVKLSLYNPGPNPVDVDDVSLKTADGREIIKNGDFSNDSKRWLFVTDQDLAWHIHQQEIEMYFAQGVLGLSSFIVFLVALTKVIWPAVRTGNGFSIAIAAGLIGFFTVGLLGSAMDTSRLSMLFYVGGLMGGLLPKQKHLEKATHSA